MNVGFIMWGTILTGLTTSVYTAVQHKAIEEQRDLAGANLGSLLTQLATGYANKIADYEALEGRNFMSTTIGDSLTYTTADEVFNNLRSDGSVTPACTDDDGVIIGLAINPYISCQIAASVPGGGSKEISATFQRVALVDAPAGYTTGFTQIKGRIIVGSADENTAFSAIAPDFPNRDLAERARSWAKRKGTLPITTQVLVDVVTDYEVTEAGALVIDIDLTRSNELSVRRDGITPFTGNQSFGGNEAYDLSKAGFTSRYTVAATEVGEEDTIESVEVGSLAATSDATGGNRTLTLDANNNLVVSAPNFAINTTTLALTSTGNTTLSAANASLDENGQLDLMGGVSSGEGTFSVDADGNLVADGAMSVANDTFQVDIDGNVIANGITATSGAKLSEAIQNKGYYLTGSTVMDLDCHGQGESKMLILPVGVSSQNSTPIVRSFPTQTAIAGGYVVDLRVVEQDGTVANAGTGSYVAVQQWCQ